MTNSAKLKKIELVSALKLEMVCRFFEHITFFFDFYFLINAERFKSIQSYKSCII